MKGIKANNLISFIIKEAQHRVINDNHTKNAKSALAACMKNSGKNKGKKRDKNQSDITCKNQAIQKLTAMLKAAAKKDKLFG